jgi:hypothetical protein
VIRYRTKRELLIQIIQRDRKAGRKQKKSILDEFIASTGYFREYASRLMCPTDVLLLNTLLRHQDGVGAILEVVGINIDLLCLLATQDLSAGQESN